MFDCEFVDPSKGCLCGVIALIASTKWAHLCRILTCLVYSRSNKYGYLRRFIRVAEIPTPARVVQWVMQGAIEWM